jgi:TPR repeat protein
MRRALPILFFVVLAACNREKRARRELTDDGYLDVVLTPSGSGYTFTATNGAGQHCTGDVQLHGGETNVTSRCSDVCTKTESKACFAMGQRNEASDPTEAVRDYETGCEAGDVSSCVNAGVMYDKGKGITKDLDKSFLYDKKGCDGKDAQGCLNVAIDYDLGLGTPKDLAAAYTAADFACTGKIMNGCKMAGLALVMGKGVPRDLVTGMDKLDRACSSAQAFGACLSLGVWYVDGMHGVKRDVARGQKLLENACTHDEHTACFDLGHYIGTKTIKGSDATMIDYLKKACDAGEGGGCNELGIAMEHGEAGLAKDLDAALRQYTKGCDLDDAMSCRNEGVMYELGRGTPKDLAKAGTLYDKCCADENKECCTFKKTLGK